MILFFLIHTTFVSILDKDFGLHTTDSLSVPAVRLSTVGRRAFPVAGACIWNDLPSGVTSSPFLQTFKQRLNAPMGHRRFYPGLTF